MTIARWILGAALLLAPPLVPSAAYQPPILEPDGTFDHVLHVLNAKPGPRSGSARVRLRGHPCFGTPRQAAVRGAWVEVPEVLLESGESVDVPLALPVPADAPPLLAVEIRGDPGLIWRGYIAPMKGAFLVEPATLPPGPPARGGESLPFRVLAGGDANPDSDEGGVRAEVAATAEEWDALRADFGVLAPESWGLQPAESDEGWLAAGYWFADFAAAAPPDLGTETVLGIRTPGHGVLTNPRRLVVHSVERRADGTVVCRYSYRVRRIPLRPGEFTFPMTEPGQCFLIAIPRTEGPVEFRRVP